MATVDGQFWRGNRTSTSLEKHTIRTASSSRFEIFVRDDEKSAGESSSPIYFLARMGFSAQHPRVRVFSKVHPRPTHKESKPQKSDIFLGFRLNPDQANIYLGHTFAAVHTRCSVHRFELIAVKDNKSRSVFLSPKPCPVEKKNTAGPHRAAF